MTASNKTYDYIVVGAGSAGCVVARRLCDDPAISVLLLEAGPPGAGFWIRTPAGMAKLFKSERYNWRFHTEPVPTLRNRQLYWPRGKALGGSSAINGMVYTRGDRRDYDHWEQLGNPGWSWKDVLPYFKRSEANQRGASEWHGADGLLSISDPAIKHPTVEAFIEAARQTGLPRLDDLNCGEQEGAGFLQATIRNGQRHSAYDAFIAPILKRRNLTVRTSVYVKRVLFAGREATGVEILENGSSQVFHAAREVVLCAGALASPQLLMLSGIGSGQALQQQGIDTLVHLPGVGQNLQDHFSVRVQAQTTPGSSHNRQLNGWRKYWHGMRYVATRQGYLALGSSTAAAFMRSAPEMAYPDMEISFRSMTFSYNAAGTVAVDPYDAVSASVMRVRPASRGEVLLRSPDPLQPPAFVPNYLQAAQDVTAMLSGLRTLRRILAAEPLASRVVAELVPGPKTRTDQQLIDFMEREGHCAFHPAGTCKMGSDAMAVVDERLRVRGVSRLRVVDASIMPVVVSANTNAATIMIGEKGADLIRFDALQPRAT